MAKSLYWFGRASAIASMLQQARKDMVCAAKHKIPAWVSAIALPLKYIEYKSGHCGVDA